MSSNTVAEFASELKKSPDTLLEQLRSAGVDKSAPSDALTETDKQKLLSYLQASHGTATGERKKITLVKKSTSEIKQADSTGKARTIQVEVRKKRTFVKRDATDIGEAPAADAVGVQDDARVGLAGSDRDSARTAGKRPHLLAADNNAVGDKALGHRMFGKGARQPALVQVLLAVRRGFPDFNGAKVRLVGFGVAQTLNDGQFALLPQGHQRGQ